MHMVWHYTPRQNPVPLAIEVQQGLLDQLAEALVAQPTLAMAFIFVASDTFPQFDLPPIPGSAGIPAGEAAR